MDGKIWNTGENEKIVVIFYISLEFERNLMAAIFPNADYVQYWNCLH